MARCLAANRSGHVDDSPATASACPTGRSPRRAFSDNRRCAEGGTHTAAPATELSRCGAIAKLAAIARTASALLGRCWRAQRAALITECRPQVTDPPIADLAKRE